MSYSPPPHIELPNRAPSSTRPPYDPVGIFWDYENCPPSSDISGYGIVDNIRVLVSQFGAVNAFKTYLQIPENSSQRQSTLRSELQLCGLSLTDYPHNGKNLMGLMMTVDIMAFIKDNPPSATVIIISGDRDFAYLLSTIRWRKYNVVLIANSSMTHKSLTAQANVVYDWKSDVLKTSPPPKPPLSRLQTLSSVASLTTSQESGESPESDLYAVDHPPNEHVTPAIHPLSPPPRPASALAISAIRSEHATLSPVAPSVEPEATPVPPTTGTSIGTVHASVPSNPISDDWAVVDLAGRSVVDPASSEASEPIDEDSIYSPAFSSPEMIVSKGEGNIPSSPGRLVLIDEESSIESTIHNPRDMNLSCATRPVLRACKCKICARSPVLLASQTLAQDTTGDHEVEPTSRGPSLSPPTGSPPAVPLPESSPTRKNPLNVLAPTFVPRTPHLSRAEVAKVPLEMHMKRDFGDLTAILSELSANGDSAPRFSTVFSLWRGRKPDMFETAGAAQFKAYLKRAESVGIVALERHQDGDGWVTLRNQQNADSGSTERCKLPQHTGSRFRDLIATLNDLRLAGDPEPQFVVVGPRLLRMNPSVFADAGVTKFEEYVQAAARAGVVTVRGVKSRDGSLKLCSGCCSPPVCSLIPTGATRIPPTRAATTTSPFAPLVELLKFKRLTSAQPVSFSRIYAHLFSAFGYAGLVSLCRSVPGVTTFGQYIDAAIASGLVSLARGTATPGNRGQIQGVGLRLPDDPPPPAQPSVSTTPLPSLRPAKKVTVSPPPANITPSSFRDLTTVLRELQTLTGGSVFWFSSVVPLLLKRRPDVYASVGVAKFTDYVTLAMENGVVSAGGMELGDGWVSLDDSIPGGLAVTSGQTNHRKVKRLPVHSSSSA